MAIHDNSFERQILDFYGLDRITEILDNMLSENEVKNAAIGQIAYDIAMKLNGISKDEMERQKNILQIELYAQLEKDRSNANK